MTVRKAAASLKSQRNPSRPDNEDWNVRGNYRLRRNRGRHCRDAAEFCAGFAKRKRTRASPVTQISGCPFSFFAIWIAT
jgi:hypothetical protein